MEISVDQAARGTRNVPGKIELFGKDVGSSAGKQCQGHAIAIRSSGQAVYNFIEGAVAAAGDDELTMFADGLLSDLNGVTGSGSLREFGLDTVRSKNTACLVEKLATPIAAITG